ncbi:hypothetical protein, variant [Aphanomyces astaci]|uniref:GH16 domain-containing protein n=1 Tax=Aphanomyces astaci TaxID=112090 RepID=W4FN55_APHAT|nr:hypothetical protein, variant [Aphanomyces astaci]ETV68937.1 hypothetical protein, variant [Aphanomyces astaci]|eukprot:XP_009841613.1 hypothetical protein, variant [Aphanomyces astaci]
MGMVEVILRLLCLACFLSGATPTKTYRLASSALQISPSVGTFPVLPSVLVQGETLASLVVSLTTSATISVVANVNANHSFVILPSASLRGLSSPQTISISVQGGEKDATGVYTIRFTSMTTNETLYSSQVTVVPPPQAYSVQEGAWTGTTLASDTFDALPFGAIPNASTSIWTAIEHGFASDTCGKVGSTGNALYFTHLGNRMASTTPFDLRGIDAQLSFAYIYGHLPNESYDGYGNNTLSCEQVQPGAEVSVEISRDNGTTWQRLVTIPLSSPPVTIMQTTLLPLPSSLPSSLLTNGAVFGTRTTSFRWIQHAHTSTRVGAIQGTRYQWQYRNLFDQWAIDNVLLTARVQPPKLLATTATSGRDALTVQVITSSSNGVVLTTVGDGSHAFPVCPSNASTAVASNATVTLRTTGFIHAVTCWRGSQSYGYRSPRLYIQSPPPTFQITTTVNQTYVINVTMPRPNMQLWFTFGTGNDMPSCTFGSYLNVTSGVTATMDVGSNGVLRALACGRGLVGSEIVTLPPFVVQPKAPAIALVAPVSVTSTAIFNISVSTDAVDSTVLVRTLVSTDTDTSRPPSCLTATNSTMAVSTSFVAIQPSQRVVAVACCSSTYCNDSTPVYFGPVDASCALPSLATRCSTTTMRTVVAMLTPGTTGGIVKSPLALVPPTLAGTAVVVKAITCLDGLRASDPLVTTVAVDMCCAGALTFPSSSAQQTCSHVLLFRDDFISCNWTKWMKYTTQYGGDNINGGVHSDNVQCQDNTTGFNGASTLSLAIHGDRFTGSTPIGVMLQAGGGSVTPRLPTTPLEGWMLPGVHSFPCSNAPSGTVTCAARRVGAAVSTVDSWNAGVASFQLQTCPSFGVVSEVWALDMSGVQAAVAASPALPYADLWRASLNQERTVPYVQFSFGPSITDTQVHSFVLQWNRTAGRANVYRDGQLIRKLRALPASPDPAPLTFHSWVPNAWAGEPRFDSCSTQVSNVQVVKLETAANRWCDWEDAVGGGGGVECDSDATCSQWMTTACLMPVASAVCVNNTCVFGLHPQFASPAVKAASAFHSFT